MRVTAAPATQRGALYVEGSSDAVIQRVGQVDALSDVPLAHRQSGPDHSRDPRGHGPALVHRDT